METDFNENLQSLPPGTRLEEFEIIRVLGSGGFGITYLARDTRLGREVVIKENLPVQFCFRNPASLTVAPRHTHGDDVENFRWSLENFTREASLLAGLDHPGIVKVLRSFEAFGTGYFVMPFVEGEALDELGRKALGAGRPFGRDEVLGLLEHMLEALAYLHARGIWHRDVKPGNILVTSDGRPVLIDFGAARQRLGERSMTVLESPGYTPFEQLQSRGNVGPWSDLYALGATLCKVLTGDAPPKANDRILDDSHAPLATRAAMVRRYGRDLLEGIDRATCPKAAYRWQSAGEWLADLAPHPHRPEPSMAEEILAVPEKRRAGGRKTMGAVVVVAALIGLAAWGSGRIGVQRVREVTAQHQVELEKRKREPVAAEVLRQGVLESEKGRGGTEATKESPFENSLGMKFVPIGTTTGGKVVLFSVWETRRKDYEAFANAIGGVDGEWRNAEYEGQGVGNEATHPVVCVSFEDAEGFCVWLTRQERANKKIGSGDEYRLPTDAEWSNAIGVEEEDDSKLAQQEKDTKIDLYPWNDGKGTWPPPQRAGNYDSYSSSKISDDGYDRTSPVGSFAANRYGIHDLGGNVWEWCGSYKDRESGTRVLRGGSWYDIAMDRLLSSFRSGRAPASRSNYYGFRCVLVVSSR